MQGIWPDDFKQRVLCQVDSIEAERDPSEVLKVIEDLSKEQMIREGDRCSDPRGAQNSVHEKRGKVEGFMVGQPSSERSAESFDMEGIDGRTGLGKQQEREQYLIASRGVCCMTARSGHYKEWCPYRE